MDFPVLTHANFVPGALQVTGYVGLGDNAAAFQGALVDLYLSDSLGNEAEAQVRVAGILSIVPGAASVAPLASINLAATGGEAGALAWSFVANASGATLDPATGRYVAGATGDVSDIVRVRDSAGNVATTTLAVTAALAISPNVVTLAPLGSVTFVLRGGLGTGYMLEVVGAGGHRVRGPGALRLVARLPWLRRQPLRERRIRRRPLG